MYEMSQRYPVWVAENHVKPCNSAWTTEACVCAAPVLIYITEACTVLLLEVSTLHHSKWA
jgi:hypothetical protein